MVGRKIIVGSRDSKLAVIQSEIVMAQIRKTNPDIILELVTMKTTGDLILDKTLDKIGGKGLFIKELDKALEDGIIDISVHSLKDMPANMSAHLPIAAYSKREDPRDVLILPEGISALNLAEPIGCSSARRKFQALELFEDILVEPVRGNVLTRLRKLDEGHFGGLILAYAGLIRLSLENRVSRLFTTEEMIPSPGQGVLAIQGRKGEDFSFLSGVHNKDSEDMSIGERACIRVLDGGCSSPVAAFAEIHGNEMKITGFYMDPDTGQKTRAKVLGDRCQAEKLGYQLALKLLEGVR